MKKLYVLLFLFSVFYGNAQDPFITKWNTTTTYPTITVPIEFNSTNNYSINFGDGVTLTGQTGSVNHTYTTNGVHTVTISGNFKRINFSTVFPTEVRTLIQSIEQWGDTQWTTMESAFGGCSNLVINATDTPDLSLVTSTSYMFSGTTSFDQSINSWDVSHITNMSYMFSNSAYNQPLNNWNVSNVTNMSSMFQNAKFNQPINNWNVSNVTDMGSMFAFTNFFNQPLDNWDVSNVTDMKTMFIYAKAFNQSLSNWDTSNVTRTGSMFCETLLFNQPLNNWNVSNVTDMSDMFWNAHAFNQPLNNWDTSNVTQMQRMFAQSVFNQPLNDWDVSNVTNMTEMFRQNWVFNQPLNNWDVSQVSYMEGMFGIATAFNQDLSNWAFKPTVYLDQSSSSYGFVKNSGLNTINYDALLLRFAQLQLQNKYIKGNSELRYCDSGVRSYLVNNLGWTIVGDAQSTSCIGNDISGNVRLDSNANGCDINDMGISNFLVSADNNATMFSYSTSASTVGAYTMKVPTGTYSLSLLNLPEYFTVNSATSQIVFANVGGTQTQNFCLTANQTVNDLNVALLPLEEARPGFETDYQLVVQNMGTQAVTGATVNLIFDNTLQSFLNANPAPTTTTANQLTFTIANLQPLQTNKINLTMQLFEPPIIDGDEISNFTATVTSDANDFTPEDNTFELAQTIVNSYDPNDKLVLQGEEIFVSETDKYLNYIIRFQNTGTASAITVKIKDVLHENLDWNTLQMVSASHNYRVVVKEGNQAEFIFDNINLPHTAANEAGSHGFIAYKIKPIAGIAIGDVMDGDAAIYFDYNLPIITNVASTTVVADIEPMQISAMVTPVSCNGANDGTAMITATGGSGDYTYSWLPSGGTEATATGLVAGDYTVTVTDGFGNINTLSVSITQPLAIVIANQPADVVLTAGDDTTFSVMASNVEEYQWQASADGTNWDDITNGGTAPVYSGTATAILTIEEMPLAYDGYKYRVLLSNGVNCVTETSYATVEVNDIAGITEQDGLGITIYPNPSQGDVFINIPDFSNYANLKISVLDMNGRTLLEETISDPIKTINTSRFESGVYIFAISSDKFRFSKFVVKE
jgi:surface protein